MTDKLFLFMIFVNIYHIGKLMESKWFQIFLKKDLNSLLNSYSRNKKKDLKVVT
jgi:hypothetical protein